MQRLSLALFVFVGFCTFLAVGYAHSTTGNEKLYKSEGPWSLLTGSCALKVRANGDVLFFEPVGISNTEFMGQAPDSSAIPQDLTWSKDTSGGTVYETLHVEFAANSAGTIQPTAFHMSRSYKLQNVEKQHFEWNCGDLK